WDFSLVDPDNRRPVDYKLRRQLLAEIERRTKGDPAAFAAELLRTREDGRIKLHVTHRCLSARRDQPELFLDGDYTPLRAKGPKAAHVCAFARASASGAVALAVAPVLIGNLLGSASEPVGEDVWAATSLVVPQRLGCRFRNLFTGELLEAKGSGLALRDIMAGFPVALLITK
ncbi:MAG TPA: malto-oligosyltrehalose synthase, partial [Chloroflexota bacterium]